MKVIKCIYLLKYIKISIKQKKQRRGFMKQTMAKTLWTVHTLWLLEDKKSINFYALLKLYARDG